MRNRFLAAMASLCVLMLALNPAPALAKCGGSGGQTAGAVIGGIFGAVIGHSVAGKGDKTLGAVLGGGLGVFIGSKIGKALDTCEQEKMARATETALNSKASGQANTQTWSSESREDVNGSVSASPAQTLADGRVCRNVTQVNYVDGQEMKDNPRFCRTPPSTSWAPA